MPDKIYPLNILPGIQRDGTVFSSNGWIDGLWVRFQRGLPRKIGGYRELAKTDEIVRGTYVVPNPPNFNVFYGTGTKLYALPIGPDPTDPITLGPPVDRTPASFSGSQYNSWAFDTTYASETNSQVLVAFANQNLSSIANRLERPIFYGDLNANTPLVSTGFSVSGGVTVLFPYLFAFGNDGKVTWFQPNSVTDVRNSAYIAGDKIVAALPTRGGTNSPAGLFWSLSSVIRATYNGDPETDFNFDTVSAESSILSSNSIIEYDNLYFWLGVDRFLLYNGTVQELPNDKNINFFFDNLNYSQRQKVWATKVTSKGEIWWHYPRGNSTECNAAIIYNVREKTWYPTLYEPTGTDGRSSGYFDQTFSKPIWSGTTLDENNDYPLYVHEIGRNKVLLDGSAFPISSNFKTCCLSYIATLPNSARADTDVNMFLTRIEPDCLMTGDMNVIVTVKQYAHDDETQVAGRTFDSSTKKIDLNVMGREIYLNFQCSGLDCDYQFGQTMIVGKLGDVRA